MQISKSKPKKISILCTVPLKGLDNRWIWLLLTCMVILGDFYSFCVFFLNFSPRWVFSRISPKNHELLASIFFWHLSCCWHPCWWDYCCWHLRSTGIPPVAVLSYAVDVGNFSIVSAAVLPTVNYVLVASSCCCCWRPCWVLLAALLLLLSSLMLMVPMLLLPPCMLLPVSLYFCKLPMLLLLSLLCWQSWCYFHSCSCFWSCLWAVMFLVAGVTATACVTADACIPVIAGVLLFLAPFSSWLLTFAGRPAFAGVPGVAGIPVVAFVSTVSVVTAVAGFPAVSGVLALRIFWSWSP